MDKGSKVQTTDMTALQSDLVTIATGMKRSTVLENAGHVEKATYTGKVLATDIQNIRAAINGLEAESSGNCCESNCCQTCQGCQSQTCQSSTCQSCQGCQKCQSCQTCQSVKQCRVQDCSQCSIKECYSNCSNSYAGDCGGSDDGGP